jgi:hypothetical protein
MGVKSMIAKRFFCLFLDFLFTIIPCLALYISLEKKIDFTVLYPFFFFLGNLVQLLYSKGLTSGMALNKIEPFDENGEKLYILY